MKMNSKCRESQDPDLALHCFNIGDEEAEEVDSENIQRSPGGLVTSRATLSPTSSNTDYHQKHDTLLTEAR
jgi:hypothetical protein